ncbi:S49 family peptidase [Escherichia coli]
MRRNLSHIIAAAFNEPLLLEPAYARVFFCALGREMGAASLSVPQQQVQLDAPGMLAETDEYMAGGKRPARVYRVVNGIAVLPVTGTLVHRLGGMRPFSGMTGYDGIVACLQQAMADSQVRGVLLDIDSPGGQAAGAFDCADMIYRLRQQKPVWALCNDTACSAAMLLASACSRRLVTQTSRIGSIGVMMSHVSYAGQLKLAEVDEPRFERDGLLIEGQRTNYLRNSNKPDSWTVHSALNKTFGTDKRGFNYATVTPTESIVGTTGGYTVHGVVAADRFPLASGECFTFSCRVKGAKARCRLRVSVIIGGTDTFSADSYLDLDTRIATVSGNTSLITAKAEQQGEWTYYESTYTANTDIDTVNCAFYMSNKISNEPFYDDSTLTMTTPQIELGNTASSFIVTTMPTTRASDVVTIPSQNNLSTRPFTVLCEVSRSWSTPPNVAPRIFDVGGHSIDDNYLSLGFVSTGKISANVGMVQPQIASDGERFIVGVRAKSDLSVNAICNGNYTTNLNGKIFGITATSYRFGGQTAAGTRHLFGHIRNFRVWFKELNDRQIKEAV